MNNYNIVMCYMYNGKVLNNSKRYAFKAYEEITSDLILVDTCCGFQVAKVVEVLSVEEYKEHYKADVQKEMVCNINICAYTDRQYKKKRIKELKKQMDSMITQFAEIEKYQYFANANKNPEFNGLFEEYKSITSGN